MNAAVYARKSTEQRGVADDAKSVTRQIDSARSYAIKKGWQLRNDHIYSDDGVSGAEFDRRPGLQAMLAEAKQRSFRYVIVADQSRLGRETAETMMVLKQLKRAGVDVVSYLDGTTLTPRGAMGKAMTSMRAFGDEMHREQSAAKAFEAHQSKHQRGYVVGGRTFGYRNVDVFNGVDAHGRPLRSHVVREIVPEEAAIVRRIFELYAAGSGLKRICRTLNDEQAPPPKPFVRKHAGGLQPLGGWMPSTVRHVLGNESYRGVYVWNKSKKRNDDGEREQRPRPASEWKHVEVPEWRIVSDDLWNRVQAMRTDQAELAARFSDGKLIGRPPRKAATNLLAGLAQCGKCGGGMVVQTYKTSDGKPRRSHYMCSRKRLGLCSNDMRLELNETNETILSTIEKHALTPEAIERVILLAEESAQEDAGDRLRRELKDIEKKLGRFLKAIEAGVDPVTIAPKMKELEAEKRRITDALADQKPIPRVPVAVVDDRLAEWRRMLRGSVTQGRQVLDRVLAGRIVFSPADDGCTFEASTRFGRLFDGFASKTSTLRRVPDWMIGAPEDEPIDPAWLPDANYGRLLDRAVQRLREKSGTRDSSPPGFEPGFQP